MGAGRKFDEFSGETKWLGRNLLVDGKSGINLVSPRYTFVKQGPVEGEEVFGEQAQPFPRGCQDLNPRRGLYYIGGYGHSVQQVFAVI